MSIKPALLLKLSLTVSLAVGSLNLAYACSPAFGARPASIADKAQHSNYVFDGVITEIKADYIKVRVDQYFKGEGGREVIISEKQQTSCDDQFTLNQRSLFFTTGNINKQLDAVYDGAFGSVRGMNAENFSAITKATQCMATYEGGVLNIPCVSHKEANKVYHAVLGTSSATGHLLFSVNSVQEINQASTECMATYHAGRLNIPCVADKATEKVYHAMLEPNAATDSLLFSLGSVQQVTHIKENTSPSVSTNSVTDTFDSGKEGTVPKGWQAGMTGFGDFDWKLEKDSTAPSGSLVLNQSSDGMFPWCVKKDSHLANGFVSVKVKPISGNVDRAAGVVWRWKDEDNYYVARANALEDNVSIYYMKDGERVTLKYEKVPRVERNVWQTLRVDFEGERFIVSFEGQKVIDITDDAIKGEGRVGVWTKEDSITSFDDFSYGGK